MQIRVAPQAANLIDKISQVFSEMRSGRQKKENTNGRESTHATDWDSDGRRVSVKTFPRGPGSDFVRIEFSD